MAEFSTLPRVRGELLEVRPGRHLSVAHQPGGDTVVFFGHGGGGNKDQWRELWRDLGDQGHTLVAWDLLGHGESDKPRKPQAYAWDELVADELAVLRRYGGERNIIVAHSFGTGLVEPAGVDTGIVAVAVVPRLSRAGLASRSGSSAGGL